MQINAPNRNCDLTKHIWYYIILFNTQLNKLSALINILTLHTHPVIILKFRIMLTH